MAAPSSTFTLPPALAQPIDVLLIDNFDSFTWNLYQSFSLLGAKVTVIRNDAIPAHALRHLNIRQLVISPGPGHPKTDSGISRDAIAFFAGKVPILGVCMGLECLVDVFGGDIGYAGEIMHGKVSKVKHDNRGIFRDIPQLISSTRYHSLAASLEKLPATLQISAISDDSGVIMAVRHRKYTLEAMQYHPESVLSESGDAVLKNFLSLRGGSWEDNPASHVLDESLPHFPIDAIKTPGSSTPFSKSTTNKIPTILEKIYAQRIKDVELAKATPGTTPADLDTILSLQLAPPPIPLVPRLLDSPSSVSLMAEIKRASPSKGNIALTASAPTQALSYALAGASVISVLTEPTWFKGSLLDMRLVRAAIDALPNRPAILRKDFILDEYQIAEARIHGADTVLLIVAMLPPPRLKALYAYSLSLGMEPLVEVNNAEELKTALELGAKVVGVNNRNLHDFNVDMDTTSRLAEEAKKGGVVLCALSGILSPQDVQTYAAQGVRAVLVGEALMRAPDPKAFIRELLGWPEPTGDALTSWRNQPPLVKICGVRTPEEALHAFESGADLLGLMMVPKSKRFVTPERAFEIVQALRSHVLNKNGGQDTQSQVNGDLQAPAVNNSPWLTLHATTLSRQIRRAQPARTPLFVLVFQNQPLAHIRALVAFLKPDFVQLHGTEPADWTKLIGVPIIRVFHVRADAAASKEAAVKSVNDITRQGLNQFVLLDGVKPPAPAPAGGEANANGQEPALSGGTGTLVDWDFARSIVDKGELPLARATPAIADSTVNGHAPPSSLAEPEYPLPIFLAGGITAENVAEAVARVRPFAVDVSGGVETEDGTAKDPAKVAAFIKAAKNLA